MHALDQNQVTGRYAMAYRQDHGTPWHGLGSGLTRGASIEQWRADAGLAYAVKRSAVEFERADGTRGMMENRHVMYRDDSGAPLGVNSDGYQLVQPGECLEFFRELCDAQGFELETAGALRGGAVYWAMAKTGHELVINGRDRTAGYVLISSSCDGSSKTAAGFTSVRVVCQNTLRAAFNSAAANDFVSVRHSSKFNAEQVKRRIGLSNEFDREWREFETRMLTLADCGVDQRIADEFFVSILRPAKPTVSKAARELVKDRAVRGLEELRNSYLYAPGAAPGNAYGLIQAVTHYVDHKRGKDADVRLTSAWFGQGDELKRRAMDAAMSLAKVSQ